MPETVVRTSWGEIPMIRWTSHDFLSGQTPQQRCEQGSWGFQMAYDNGILEYIHTSKPNGRAAICVGNRKGDNTCSMGRVVVLLNPGTNSRTALSRLLNLRSIAAKSPFYQSENDLLTYVNGEAYVKVDALLKGLLSIAPKR